jgi:hypothetical protein
MSNRLTENFLAGRMALFSELIVPIVRPLSILDVGGEVEFWRGRVPARTVVTVLNTFAQEPAKQISVMIGDGCNLSSFSAKSYDIVFSNSTLAFVGSWDHQRALANEIRRIGRRYFVQTPNQEFWLDWRTLVPFFHWLPPTIQARIHTLTRVGRYRRVPKLVDAYYLATRVQDVTAKEMRILFPEATLVRERLFGLTKSFVAHYGFLTQAQHFDNRQSQQ